MSGLGRIHSPDERDKHFPLRTLIPATPPPNESRVWKVGGGMPLDQGATPRCVGYSWAGFLYSAPMQRIAHDPNPDDIYAKAQALDGMKLPHDGSTVRAGVQALQQMGHIDSYHWAASIADVRDYVLTVGPLVFGTEWLTQMDSPDAKGIVTVGGTVRGDHAYLCRGYHGPAKLYECEQSWGDWGLRGRFFIHETGVQELLFGRGTGEACSAIEKATP